jgi:hypothetical protein
MNHECREVRSFFQPSTSRYVRNLSAQLHWWSKQDIIQPARRGRSYAYSFQQAAKLRRRRRSLAEARQILGVSRDHVDRFGYDPMLLLAATGSAAGSNPASLASGSGDVMTALATQAKSLGTGRARQTRSAEEEEMPANRN